MTRCSIDWHGLLLIIPSRMSFQHSKNLHADVLLFSLSQVFIFSFSIHDLNGRKSMTSSLQLLWLIVNKLWLIVNHLTSNFPTFKKINCLTKLGKLSTLLIWKRCLFHTSREWKWWAIVTPILYGKLALVFIFYFLGFCCSIFWSL